MHLTTVILKNGEAFSGFIKRVRPLEGYILLDVENNGIQTDRKVLLKDAQSIITEGERISVSNRYANEDEMARMRQLGWDGS